MPDEQDVVVNGRNGVRNIRAQWRDLVDQFHAERPLHLAIATALLWSKHAVSPPHFYPAALDIFGLDTLLRERRRLGVSAGSDLSPCRQPSRRGASWPALPLNFHRPIL